MATAPQNPGSRAGPPPEAPATGPDPRFASNAPPNPPPNAPHGDAAGEAPPMGPARMSKLQEPPGSYQNAPPREFAQEAVQEQAKAQDEVTASVAGFPPTESVRGAERSLALEGPVSAWRVVRELLEAHREYGGGLAERVLGLTATERFTVERPASEWIDAARALLRPNARSAAGDVIPLHGRLLIVCLARLDQELGAILAASGFLAAVEGEIEEPFETLLRPASERANAVPPDPAPLHLDDPASTDRLGRRGFARGLAFRLNRIWADNVQSPRSSSFILHLHGPWGAGKTSLLNLLREELQSGMKRDGGAAEGEGGAREGGNGGGWIVIDFNAWKNQRLDPPWWPLLEAVYRQSRMQLAAYGDRRRAWRLRAREWAWRLAVGRRELLITLAVFVPAAAAVYWLLVSVSRGVGLPGMAKNADSIGKVIGLVGAVVTALVPFARALFAGSARSAQSFVDSANDPLTRVALHFDGILRTVERPVAIVIDDLDRCQRGYVVTLLEGIQTLFSSSRAVYVVAADRRWLDTSFEKAYSEFSDTVVEPGRRLGSLFLEKCFQLSVSMPRISDELKHRYWDFLIRGAPAETRESIAEVESRVRREMSAGDGFEDVLSRAAAPEADPLVRQMRREVAVELLANVEVERGTEAFLAPFAPLVGANPRSMKRFVNAYAVHRDLAILAGVDLRDAGRRKQLALWTIVALQWPALQDYFMERLDGGAPPVTDDVRALNSSPEVQRVLNGNAPGVGVALDMEAVGAFAELRTTASSVSTVA